MNNRKAIGILTSQVYVIYIRFSDAHIIIILTVRQKARGGGERSRERKGGSEVFCTHTAIQAKTKGI